MGRSNARMGGCAGSASLNLHARLAAVGASKIDRMGSSIPSSVRKRLIKRVAKSEFPPKSKKLSSALAYLILRMSQNNSTSNSSFVVVGVRRSWERKLRGGRPLRFTLPLGVSGSEAKAMIPAGIMYSGRCADISWRRIVVSNE
ncbi:hypothetical protein D3C85_1152650 [compost metagenome]